MSDEDSPVRGGPLEEDPGTIRATYDWSVTSPNTAVIETVAIAADQEPTTMEPLYERIDPDALESLVRAGSDTPPPTDVRVSFRYNGHVVTVRDDGEVVVRPDRAGVEGTT